MLEARCPLRPRGEQTRLSGWTHTLVHTWRPSALRGQPRSPAAVPRSRAGARVGLSSTRQRESCLFLLLVSANRPRHTHAHTRAHTRTRTNTHTRTRTPSRMFPLLPPSSWAASGMPQKWRVLPCVLRRLLSHVLCSPLSPSGPVFGPSPGRSSWADRKGRTQAAAPSAGVGPGGWAQ